MSVLDEAGERLSEALTPAMTRLGEMGDGFVRLCHKAYQGAGTPYGTGDDGMGLWLCFLLRELEDRERQRDPLSPETLTTFKATFLDRGPS